MAPLPFEPNLSGEGAPKVNTDNAAYSAVISGFILLGIAIVLVAFRVGTKLFTPKAKLRIDDWAAMLAVFFAIARMASIAVNVYRYDIGRHIGDIPPENFIVLFRLKIVSDMFYIAAILFAKLTVLAFYLNIFHINRTFRMVTLFTMVFVTMYLLAGLFTYIFQCRPIKLSWEWSAPLPKICLNGIQQSASIGGFNIGTDLFIMLMPLPMVWKLQLSTKNKIGLSLIFALGSLTVIAAIVREVIVLTTLSNTDSTWSLAGEMLWLNIEMNVAIICGSLLALPPLYRQVLASRFGNTLRQLLSPLRFTGGSSRTSRSHTNISSRKVPHSETDADSTKHINGQYVELQTRTVVEASHTYSREDIANDPHTITLRSEVDVR